MGAFGEIQSRQENLPNRILYTGQQYDQISGQYYLRARFYNPVVGKFLQEDVYRGDGLNLYAYCKNNPVIYYDPSGFAFNYLLPNELDYGTYKYLNDWNKNHGGVANTHLTPHHAASKKYLKENYGIHPNDGLSIMFESTSRQTHK